MKPTSRRHFLAAAASTTLGAAWAAATRGQPVAPASATPAATTNVAAAPATAPAPIDRKAVVARHDVRLRKLDPATPLHVGNGDFAFGCDVTGLQTFAEPYRAAVPLHTMATWAWHAAPEPEGGASIDRFAREYAAPGRDRPVVYYDRVEADVADAEPPTTAATAAAISPAAAYLRDNPHRAALGRIAFVGAAGSAEELRVDQIGGIDQSLELWTGLARSKFTLDGEPVDVTTAAHPTRSLVAFRVRSPLLAKGALAIRIAFPAQRADPSDPDDWTRPDAHRTTLRATDRAGVVAFEREQGAFAYAVRAGWSTPDATRLTPDGPHAYVLRTDADWIELAVEFSPAPTPAATTAPAATSPAAAADASGDAGATPAASGTSGPSADAGASAAAGAGVAAGAGGTGIAPTTAPAEPPALPTAADVFAASTQAWERFWRDGAAVDFGGCTDPRAVELERRVVRSQFLTAVHCAGVTPAPETGLVCNSMHGKLRLDTTWWTAAHFAMWGRPAALERLMRYYGAIVPLARRIARRQGYEGARWPGLAAGPRGGDEVPGEAAPFWIWQQPHPIYFAEQIYRAKPTRETLERFGKLVAETAQFMASFPAKVEGADVLSLGPPLVPAQQRYTAERDKVRDPTFELAYWAWGLGVAQRWRERLGDAREPRWDEVIQKLAKPKVREGRYDAIGVEPFLLNGGHPSFLMALGMLPKTHLIDEGIMRETARWTAAQWRWETAWGADFAVLAQTAARLGEPGLAIEALLKDAPTNRYLENGHHAPQAGMPVLLSANGALLAAVALMAGAWDGTAAPAAGAAAPRATPGFPSDGRWNVRVEGFERAI